MNSFFDKLDQAYERYKERHRQERPFSDDIDPAHREPKEGGDGHD